MIFQVLAEVVADDDAILFAGVRELVDYWILGRRGLAAIGGEEGAVVVKWVDCLFSVLDGVVVGALVLVDGFKRIVTSWRLYYILIGFRFIFVGLVLSLLLPHASFQNLPSCTRWIFITILLR